MEPNSNKKDNQDKRDFRVLEELKQTGVRQSFDWSNTGLVELLLLTQYFSTTGDSDVVAKDILIRGEEEEFYKIFDKEYKKHSKEIPDRVLFAKREIEKISKILGILRGEMDSYKYIETPEWLLANQYIDNFLPKLMLLEKEKNNLIVDERIIRKIYDECGELFLKENLSYDKYKECFTLKTDRIDTDKLIQKKCKLYFLYVFYVLAKETDFIKVQKFTLKEWIENKFGSYNLIGFCVKYRGLGKNDIVDNIFRFIKDIKLD